MAENKKPGQSTKSLVQISAIRGDVLILKDGSIRTLIEVGSVNFELKATDEQTAIITAFQNFINSIDFPLQIVVNSRKLNIDGYVKSLDTLAASLTNELLKIQAKEYASFIKGLTELADIMSKKFYISVPFYSIEAMGGIEKKSFLQSMKEMFGSKGLFKTLSDEEFATYKNQLQQRVELVLNSISGLGLNARVVLENELLGLFNNLYNPSLKMAADNLASQ